MDWPSAIVTTAFFHPARWPAWTPRRLGLAGTFEMFTCVTLTSKISSTAWRTWVLCASLCTRNVYLRRSAIWP